ncbi:MAG: hypothetical protein ACYDCO_12505 [Armatimonadota bacterium]
MKALTRCSLVVIAVLAVFGLGLAGCGGGGSPNTPQMPDFAGVDVLLYTDAQGGADFAYQALNDLGVAYQMVTTREHMEAHAGESFHLLVVDYTLPTQSVQMPFYDIDATLSMIEQFIADGGRVVISTWHLEHKSYHEIWPALGVVSHGAPNAGIAPVFRWDTGHSLFNFPNAVPDLTTMSGFPDREDAHYSPGSALSNAVALGGFTSPADTESGAIFFSKNGRTVLNSFLLMDAVQPLGELLVPNDSDADGIADAVELWQNEIVHVLQGDVSPVMLKGPQISE